MILRKRIFFVLLIVSTPLSLPSSGFAEGQLGTKAPIILHSYAVDKGRFGCTWRIFIEAEDQDGDMAKIACAVDQVGFGFYSRDLIRLKPAHQKHLKGYIQWNTFSNRTPYLRDHTQIMLKVSIIDKAGNESKEVAFPFEFVSGQAPEPKPPAPFEQGNLPLLGNIIINLVEPTLNEPGPQK